MKAQIELTVSFNPSSDHLSQIDSWLTAELNRTGEGYKHNWGIILKANERGCMAVLLDKNIAVGFAIWYELEFQMRLDIFCIEMKRRKKGLGSFFLGKLLDEFVNKKKFAVELQCAPANSEPYWRKHGFTDISYQISLGIGQNRWLYRSIVKSAPLSPLQNHGNFITLWDQDPSTVKAHNLQPKWTWKIEFTIEGLRLANPVVFPCQADWQVQYIRDGIVIESAKAKYLFDQNVHSNKMLMIQTVSKK